MHRLPALLATFLIASTAWAHGADAGGPAHSGPNLDPVTTAFGRTGDPRQPTRTIRVDLADTMRFTPGEITVRVGETILFVVRNRGQVLHEMVLGDRGELERHAALMKKNPAMAHEAPYMAHVAPGGSGQIVWQFTRAGEFFYGCLVPGHFEAGMVGRIRVLPTAGRP